MHVYKMLIKHDYKKGLREYLNESYISPGVTWLDDHLNLRSFDRHFANASKKPVLIE